MIPSKAGPGNDTFYDDAGQEYIYSIVVMDRTLSLPTSAPCDSQVA